MVISYNFYCFYLKKSKEKTAAAKTTTATLPITSFRVLILLDVFIYRSSCILLDFAAKP